ncbi:MAG: 50S ribosomal protein L17 [Puniceicoccaceae bacterium]|nr:MAG: 50S ribosomal protein L17 [Puniceicoccaceae bacterium]
MRHSKHRHQLGVKKEHRLALMANLAAALIREGRIRTTLAKAKALRPFVERLITLAKRGGLAQRRLAASRLRDPEAVAILFNEKADLFKDRPGGYTRIYKLAQRRIGDAAEMALIEFVGPEDTGYRKGRGRGKAQAAKPTPAAAVAAEAATETQAAEAAAEAPAETPAAGDGEAAPEKPAGEAPAPDAGEEKKG